VPTVTDAFFEPLGDGRFRATEHTGGPWDPALQHGGPPSALLARAAEQCDRAWPAHVARITVDILGPVPVGEVELSARVRRTGRSVELVEAELAAGGRTAMRASAWRIRAVETGLAPTPDVPPPTRPGTAEPIGDWAAGYLRAMEWHWVSGHFTVPGPAVVWARQRVPLVPDEEPTGVERILTLADSGNGISNTLDMSRWLFINPELTVHFAREPVGEWVCLDAVTTVTGAGTGLATSILYDDHGVVARGAQALLVGPRSDG
jgi:hypothetical protein